MGERVHAHVCIPREYLSQDQEFIITFISIIKYFNYLEPEYILLVNADN